MSGAEIDKAKKEFTVDNGVELNLLRQKYDEELKKNEKKLMPYFFAHIDRCKG